MIRKPILSNPGRTAVALLLAAFTVLIYLRSEWHVCVGDELRYFYQFHLKPGQTYFHFRNLRPVENLGDVLDSQLNHYLTVNGRTPVHTLEQIFSGVLTPSWFYPVNALVWLATLLLFVRLAGGTGRRWAPTALLSAVLWLFAMPAPDGLYTSINLSLNYLWPAGMCLSVLCLWQRLRRGWRPGWFVCVMTALWAFVCGWSHEGYVFPLAGALGIYYIIHLRRLRGRQAALTLCFWSGATVMLAAPGNWLRASQVTGFAARLQTFGSMLPSMSVMLLLIAVLTICAVRNRRRLGALLKAHSSLCLCCLLSTLMTLAVHTGARSLAPMCIYGSLLLMTLVSSFERPFSRRLRWSYVALGIAALAWQLCITVEHRRQYLSIVRVRDDYRNSPDGRVIYRYAPPPAWLRPYVYHLPPNTDGSTRYQWTLLEVHWQRIYTTTKRLQVSQ